VVTCATDQFTLGGTVSGLLGTGLVLATAGATHLAVPAGATSFTFGGQLGSGTAYGVTVVSQPVAPSQTCTVTGGSGSVVSSNVGTVSVTCATNAYRVRGSVAGMVGYGLVLRNNGGDDLPALGDGAFVFATPVPSSGAFSVTVAAQPSGPAQTCTVAGGAGTVGAADVTGVTVTCITPRYRIRPTVSGLSGSGLVLRNNGGDDLAVGGNGSLAFATAIENGGTYAVTVASQPTGPWQSCTVSNPTGTVGNTDVTNVAVTCTTSTYRIGGTVSGLSGSGLVLRNNGGDSLSVGGNVAFTFGTRVASGSGYAVTVSTHPTAPDQFCVVTGGAGTVGGADVGNVVVRCGPGPR
jgi:hypothetical protein